MENLRISNTAKYKNKYIVGSSYLVWMGSGANGMIAIKGESGIRLSPVSPDSLNITDNEELNYWLSKLVVEVRKKKDPGSVYPPNTLCKLFCGLQQHMRDNDRPELNFFTFFFKTRTLTLLIFAVEVFSMVSTLRKKFVWWRLSRIEETFGRSFSTLKCWLICVTCD